MKTLKHWSVLILVAVLGTLFTACSDDDSDSNVPSGLVGTWYGEATSSVTGSKRQMTVTFNANHSGTMTYVSSAYTRGAAFNYTVKGTTVTCTGKIAGEDGVMNNFNQQFSYKGATLVPIGAYSDLTLRK